MDLTAFYTTVTSISFTLLGLWWVVVEGRDTWKMNVARRRMAYVVSLHFVLPGVMSALALVAPDVGILWRITFGHRSRSRASSWPSCSLAYRPRGS